MSTPLAALDEHLGNACQSIADAQEGIRYAMGAVVADEAWGAGARAKQHAALYRMARALTTLDAVYAEMVASDWETP